MRIRDIHTHLLPEEPGSALVCIGCGPVPDGALEQGHLFSAGLHPWDVTESFENQLSVLENILANPRVLAVGECGFDALKGPSHELQEQAFVRQVELSEKYGKPMILHVVRDFDSVIRLRKELKPIQPWLIHGFRGGPEQMNQLYAQGIRVSFGLKHNPETVRQVPSDRLFLETDGISLIGDVIQAAALARNESAETIERSILRNNNILLER
ncbi:MAG: TatD family hydrolase [Bacteroidaceae bacterium]|nr:TatD family hydrolase [Bacteroidaceae bacterium]